MNAAPSSVSTSPAGEVRGIFIAAQQSDPACRTAPTQPVGRGEAELGDSEREEAIKRAGELMERRYADFASSGLPADLAAAHKALVLMRELIAGRTPARQAAMHAAIDRRIEDPCYFSSDAAHSLTGGTR